MEQPAFAADFRITNPADGTEALWHVRADSAAAFAESVAELIAQQPHLASLTHRGARGIAPAPQPVNQLRGDTAEKCPTHGRAKASAYGGVFCTAVDETESNGRCSWTHGKKESRAA